MICAMAQVSTSLRMLLNNYGNNNKRDLTGKDSTPLFYLKAMKVFSFLIFLALATIFIICILPMTKLTYKWKLTIDCVLGLVLICVYTGWLFNAFDSMKELQKNKL